MKPETAPQFITEDDLLQSFGLRQGGEIQLIPGTRFTPSAQQMINDKKITVRWRDALGQVFVTKPQCDISDHSKTANHAELVFEKVHPLTSTNVRPKNTCSLCREEVTKKPALLTHLDNQELVPKTHPRILLRGKLDACICYCVLMQCEMSQCSDLLKGFIADIRSYLGHVLQAEVSGQVLPEPSLGQFGAESIHRWSHNPLKYLGHDHMLPDVIYGALVAKLNILRAQIRELELAAIHVLNDNSRHFSSKEAPRDDIIVGLNYLSSAVYVVMILVWQSKHGKVPLLEECINETA